MGRGRCVKEAHLRVCRRSARVAQRSRDRRAGDGEGGGRVAAHAMRRHRAHGAPRGGAARPRCRRVDGDAGRRGGDGSELGGWEGGGRRAWRGCALDREARRKLRWALKRSPARIRSCTRRAPHGRRGVASPDDKMRTLSGSWTKGNSCERLFRNLHSTMVCCVTQAPLPDSTIARSDARLARVPYRVSLAAKLPCRAWGLAADARIEVGGRVWCIM